MHVLHGVDYDSSHYFYVFEAADQANRSALH